MSAAMPAPQISVVVPTLQNYASLERVLAGYARQDAPAGSFEVIVVADLADADLAAVDAAIGQRSYPVRRLTGRIPGASANRNVGWRAAEAEVVLFTDDDTVPVTSLVSEHLRWHRRFPAAEVAVVGRVRWARGLKVTPFMRWLEHGIQFDFASIRGTEASWAHLYSSNASSKRSFLERVGGYDEERLPYGYEDLDLGLRGRRHGLRVLYNARAVVDHWRPTTVELWQARASRLAATEWSFSQLHPDIAPWFWRMFSDAASRPPQRGRAARLAGVVPRRTPWLGPCIWNLADLYWRQQLAPPFLTAWEAAASGACSPPQPAVSALAERSASSGGS
jgi:glycosyltransferase involved in cell wall biosynthesis